MTARQAAGSISVEERGALLAGVLYVLCLFHQQTLLTDVLGIAPIVTQERLTTYGAVHQAGNLLLRFPTLLLICIIFARPDSALRRALRVRRAGVTGVTLIMTWIASLLLNASGVWTFTWRDAESTTIDYARILLDSDQGGAIALWTITVVIANPLIEEVIFRFGLLSAFSRYVPDALAVLGSAVLFGVAHAGAFPPWSAPTERLINAAWMGAFGVLLGTIAVRRQQNISIPLAIHAARNALELLMILLVARAPR